MAKVASHARLPPLSFHIFTVSLTVGINSGGSLHVFYCHTSLWSRNQIKFLAAAFATYFVTQVMQNIVTGQTTITKGDTELLSKDFFTEGKICHVSCTFSESSWQHREDIFCTKDVFKYKYLLICLFRKAIRIICKRVMKLHT